DWKAVRFAPGRDRTVPDDRWQVELYDLAADPGETTDVASRHPAVAAELVALMRSSWGPQQERDPYGVRLDAPEFVVPGATYRVTTTFGNASAVLWTGAEVRLSAPRGWRVRALGRAALGRLAPGGTLVTTWEVTVPENAGGTAWRLRATASASAAKYGRLSFTAARRYTPPPPPPTGDAFLSDLPWLKADNGWGPVERDASNGRQAAGDGTPISFGGTTYAKGLGVHATSEVVYHVGGQAARLTALVGIDDFSARQNARGSTIARVAGDGRVLFDSGVLTAAGGPKKVDVDLTGVRLLHLVVVNADEDTGFDHTSWAEAYLHHA
ncbi:MAG TPA: NPCBM/NEW2 domain-containing protein, partial [Thermomonospora sp.]|nr:NPCBM/NEW2 domain-containing protein [Thermomonospora sp.]